MASIANTDHGSCTLRCSVEKRSMCRDLQKWSKTLLCMIGLENLAERLVGKKKHHRHGHHQMQPLQQQILRISPFIEPLLFSQSSSQSSCDAESQRIPSTSDIEAKDSLPHDWDPKERCTICIQIAEKEETAKKAQAASSRSKKEHRANADRTKETDSKSASRAEASASMATSSTQSATGLQSSKHLQPQLPSHLQHMIDWRTMNGSGGTSSISRPFGAINMFRTPSSAGQLASSSSSPFGSSGNLAASMFSSTGYPFFDLNQVYLNELLNHYSKVAAAATGGTGTNSYSMMSSLPLGVSSMAPPAPLPYSVNTAFSFPHLMASLGSQVATASSSSTPTLAHEEPLDLSRKERLSKKCGSSARAASGSVAGDGVKASSSTSTAVTVAPSQSPHDSPGSKGPASNTSSSCSSSSNPNKRTYSQADLQLAVDAIRSKQLGTRRASVVYGIPRSTLRNKIYKLEATDDDQSQSTLAVHSLSSLAKISKKTEKSGTADSKEIGSQKVDDDFGTMEADGLCDRTTTTSDDSSASLSSSPSSCANEATTFSYVDRYKGGWTTSATDLTAELAKRQAVEALWRATSANGAAGSAFSGEITSFSSPIVNGNATVKNVLQDAVCCALTENLKLKCGSGISFESTPSPTLVSKAPKSSSSKRSSSSRRRGSNSKITSSDRSPATMVKIDRPAQSASAGGGSSNEDDPSKKIRPKRGQYRKYDKNALAEAVHAVRRGEMSVHRAGSFYGVPHSTLEYKVKERNLLRPKKRDQKKKDEGGSGEASSIPATASVEEEFSAAAKPSESVTSEKTGSPATTKSKSSQSTKPKRSKRPGQQTSSPVSSTQTPMTDDTFGSVVATPVSLDLSANTTEPSAKKRKKSTAVSVSATSPLAPSSTLKSVEGAVVENAIDKPQPSTEAGDTNENSEFSTLKAYEAGFQAALLVLQMQTLSATNENPASNADGGITSQAQQGNELTAKR